MTKFQSIKTLLALAIVIWLTICFTIKVVQKFSPPCEVDASELSASALISCLDLQRELNRRYPELKLKEDGICGKATQAAWDRAVGDQYAMELMVREIR